MTNEKLFSGIEKEFNISLGEESKACVSAILKACDKYDVGLPRREKIAYILATMYHECGEKMLPITENLNYSAKRLMQVWPSQFPTLEKAKEYANDPQLLGNKVYGGRMGNGVLEGYKYRGRGFVQLTGYDNYKRFSDLVGENLTKDPDKAKDIDIGAKILVVGMVKGLFTGRKLSGSINSTTVDFYNARDVINADKQRVGKSIEDVAKKFLAIFLDIYP